MRTVLFAALMGVLFAGFFAAHWAMTHPRLAARVTPSPDSAIERELGTIAQEISGRRDVSVRCDDTGDTAVLGTVAFYGEQPGGETILQPRICATLGELASRQPLPSLACTRLGGGQCGKSVIDLAWATSALAHESHHLAGVRDEAAAECYGLQSTELVAARLGASPSYAATLADYTFWNVRPPIDGGYFSPECKDGGRLDLRPASSRWP